MADINDILEKIDIVDVVSEYVDLERKGKNYFGVCPFHDDNNPSMSVSPQKQLYKCFSCGAGGNALTFVMNIENVDFKHAASILGKSVGIEVETSYNKIKDDYFNIYLDASKFFMYSLYHTKDGEKYLHYLQERGFDAMTLNYFNIGLSNNQLVELLEKKYDSKEIKKTGLANAKNKLVFKQRIVFPIDDAFGNVVGFSGRVINDVTPKYLNTAETKYFRKSNLLYNYARAKQHVIKTKSIFITEGFFDVMRLHTVGIQNVVATMGTAFTATHAQMINDISETVYLSMDGDQAGIDASLEIYKTLVNYDLKIFMVELDGLDPDEFVIKYGVDKYNEKVRFAKVFEEYFLDYLMHGYIDLNVGGKESVIESISKFINGIKNDVVKQLLVGYVFESIGVNIKVANYIAPSTSQTHVKTKNSKSINESLHSAYVLNTEVINKIELDFLAMINCNREALEAYINEVKILNLKRNDEVAMLIREFYIQNSYNDLEEYVKSRVADYSNEQLDTLLKVIRHVVNIQIECSEQLINDYVKRILIYRYDKKINEISELVVGELDEHKRSMLLNQMTKLKLERNIIEERGTA